MATFLGTETYSIDDKNRVVVPAGMRHVGERKTPLTQFVMMRGLDGCVWLYAQEDWKRLEDLLQRLSMGPKAHRAFARTALVGASKVAVDKQGRITISPSLMGHAGLGKEAVLHGQVGRIEIWSPERFQSGLVTESADYDALAEKVLGDDE
ncbi:MAG TPA: division/cell wall cluster transcriptional repressor MraZ [Verrucomicrobiae bacterium]|jgi:transcriptional regulator MraZ|nr:division/cell wall cluster transcriptional repressor MraZ [Verrucomicrobiae bacterium]